MSETDLPLSVSTLLLSICSALAPSVALVSSHLSFSSHLVSHDLLYFSHIVSHLSLIMISFLVSLTWLVAQSRLIIFTTFIVSLLLFLSLIMLSSFLMSCLNICFLICLLSFSYLGYHHLFLLGSPRLSSSLSESFLSHVYCSSHLVLSLLFSSHLFLRYLSFRILFLMSHPSFFIFTFHLISSFHTHLSLLLISYFLTLMLF